MIPCSHASFHAIIPFMLTTSLPFAFFYLLKLYPLCLKLYTTNLFLQMKQITSTFEVKKVLNAIIYILRIIFIFNFKKEAYHYSREKRNFLR
ncbi:hypothetical protein DICVIV_01485 [Dictyocaulus viviparus]|uniref:Uncharacterized protein n=1 Tax=Dictyocaulus viviparus TaxID=29172 RepID=A0A0D8Y620_DICVI|nr:hypothetical protein DICVIV_01485 [Dictyocaulus viviparus]